MATSTTFNFIDWVQVRVPEQTDLSAEVTLSGSWHTLSKTYRLFVVGSTRFIQATDITGPHQTSYQP